MRRQRFRFTDAGGLVDWTTTLVGRAWTAGLRPIGGLEFSAARVPSAWRHREDRTLRQVIRYTEEEQATLFRMLRHAMFGGLVDVFPDQDEPLFRPAYLVAPQVDDGNTNPIEGAHAQFPGDMEVELLWMDSSDQGWETVKVYG